MDRASRWPTAVKTCSWEGGRKSLSLTISVCLYVSLTADRALNSAYAGPTGLYPAYITHMTHYLFNCHVGGILVI